MHESRFRVRSTQVDSFGHLNNAAYLEIYEWARWEWAEASGGDPVRLVEEKRIGPAILHVDLTFSKEIRHHEEITVRTWYHSMERIRAQIAQEIIKADGQVASKVLITYVMINLDTRKVTSIPDEMRAMYEADEEYRNKLG
jgi:YbgC/YbaW family acyl-CoA thioester hydrolase